MTTRAADPSARIRDALDRLAGDMPALGVAVSGGGDSIALMHIVADWACGRRVMIATVDHGLREASAAEAHQVHRAALALGLQHATLLWQRDTTTGNLMASARDARLRLLSGWAQRNDLPAVVLGHTRDDQAETLMMRLERGSGIDGLAGMADWRDAFGMRWLRPMLDVGREELRDWLRRRGIGWIDDPSNDNDDFDRIRIRKAIASIDLDTVALARAAQHIGAARDALAHYAAEAASEAVIENGRILLPRRPLRDAPTEIRRRLLVAACRWITGADYPPRRATLLHALQALASGSRVTLDGALIEPAGDRIRIGREPAAAIRAGDGFGPVWDNRWRIDGMIPGQTVSALGFPPLREIAWRGRGLSRDDAAASPAIRQDGRLIAAPLLRPAANIRIRPVRDAADFRSLLMAH
ncbi:tRNA lysidine(34) synthetase TilS [Paracoccus sp. YLB-12]|uniref:tRNA(Ile)-lysidine synthase n=1 Tax=Paracoccus maritimus TaxID=2933292 RepID=A0ABT2K977_9RHOB|nr:tRNA lysidine(34) synthetase TilS [Paracoccus sp. YLB-12]MCT4333087.1 tRNA lysidine(34) synthetase TilS [Paracoccus sp. YLB-12]